MLKTNVAPFYRPSYDKPEIPVSFSKLKSHLRLSNKYDISELRSNAVKHLEAMYPRNLLPLVSARSSVLQYSAFLNATDAIVLARECDIPSILPAAFYCLSTVKWQHNEDGGRAHIELDPLDLRRLIVGREALANVTMRLATTFSIPPSLLPADTQLEASQYSMSPSRLLGCENGCRETIKRQWLSTFISPQAAYKNVSLLRTMGELLALDFQGSICPSCMEAYAGLVREQTELLLRAIPGWFALS